MHTYRFIIELGDEDTEVRVEYVIEKADRDVGIMSNCACVQSLTIVATNAPYDEPVCDWWLGDKCMEDYQARCDAAAEDRAESRREFLREQRAYDYWRDV